MRNKDVKYLFLEQLLLREKLISNGDNIKAENIIKRCIYLAAGDMMTAGRFVFNKGKKDEIVKGFFDYIKGKLKPNNTYIIKPTEVIKDLIRNGVFGKEKDIEKEYVDKNGIKQKRTASRYGLCQKLVNMTFKYLYIFYDYIKKDAYEINFKKCDCPLDSIILKDISKKAIYINETRWSMVEKREYKDIQGNIKKYLKDDSDAEKYNIKNSIGNLAYDFLYWNPQEKNEDNE